MSRNDPLSPLDTASLLASRLCHDAIGPIGAIMNGLELLEDEGGGELREEALDLVRRSARKAAAVLEFARLACGAGAGRTRIETEQIERVVRAVFAGERAVPEFDIDARDLPFAEARLLLNLFRLAASAVARGGTVTAHVHDTAAGLAITLVAAGAGARRPQGADLATGAAAAPPDARTITAHLVALLAHETGHRISIAEAPDEVTFEAVPQMGSAEADDNG